MERNFIFCKVGAVLWLPTPNNKVTSQHCWLGVGECVTARMSSCVRNSHHHGLLNGFTLLLCRHFCGSHPHTPQNWSGHGRYFFVGLCRKQLSQKYYCNQKSCVIGIWHTFITWLRPNKMKYVIQCHVFLWHHYVVISN